MSSTTGNKTKCLLNGNGRIGRLVCRYVWEDDTLAIVAINDLCSIESAAYLLQYDSVHGKWHRTVSVVDETTLAIDGTHVAFTRCKTIADLMSTTSTTTTTTTDIDLVMECTGKFLTAAELQPYLDAGVRQVVVSAPIKETSVLNVVLGCNHQKFLADPAAYPIITNASCTTNCLAPVVKVVKEQFGIVHGCITTIHNVTGTQTLVDMPNTKKDDLRRARSGMVNLAPTSTGSATAIVEIYPDLAGKLNGLAVRVPLTNASLTDCVFEVERPVTVAQVNAALQNASQRGPLVNILGYETVGLVSTDYTNDVRSSIIDAPSTQVIDSTMVKIYAWYDNEAGYSKRMAELCSIAAAVVVQKVPPTFRYEATETL